MRAAAEDELAIEVAALREFVVRGMETCITVRRDDDPSPALIAALRRDGDVEPRSRCKGSPLAHVPLAGEKQTNAVSISLEWRSSDEAIVTVGSVCGSLCGHGHVAHLKKTAGGWIVAKKEREWIS